MGENITMAHFSQKLSMWLAEKSCWAMVPTAQGWRFCISDVCHVLTAEIRLATSSISCSPPLHFLVIPTYISLSLAKRVQAGHPRTAQFNYSQLRWSRCQILALIWKTNRAVAWWNMLDLITGRGGIHRETQTRKGRSVWLITLQQTNMICASTKLWSFKDFNKRSIII